MTTGEGQKIKNDTTSTLLRFSTANNDKPILSKKQNLRAAKQYYSNNICIIT